MDSTVWVEKYRPRTLDDAILPDSLRQTMEMIIDRSRNDCPNYIFTGKQGIGKTMMAKMIAEITGADCLVINASLHSGIDTLRNEILQFASSVSFTDRRKLVVLEEADYLNPNSTQPALRAFMEDFSSNCQFILTCNYAQKIIEPLHSRCAVVTFAIPRKERQKLMFDFYKRVEGILKEQGVEFDKTVVATVVNKYFPDMRRTINELQNEARKSGGIDNRMLGVDVDTDLKAVIKALKSKNFQDLRKWVGENPVDSGFFTKLYTALGDVVKGTSLPQLVVTINEYQFKQAFVTDPEINITAMLVEIMANCEFE
jgi:DNA polymerase III delta prime subunit